MSYTRDRAAINVFFSGMLVLCKLYNTTRGDTKPIRSVETMIRALLESYILPRLDNLYSEIDRYETILTAQYSRGKQLPMDGLTIQPAIPLGSKLPDIAHLGIKLRKERLEEISNWRALCQLTGLTNAAAARRACQGAELRRDDSRAGRERMQKRELERRTFPNGKPAIGPRSSRLPVTRQAKARIRATAASAKTR